MRKEKPKVSVLMPCYNHVEYVGQAIESVLNQTYENIELIVVDNGSTDDSYEQIKKYQDRITKLFRLEENNRFECSYILESNATGDYIALMTSDDCWELDKIELQVQAFLSDSKIKACATWITYMDEGLEGEVMEGPQIIKGENRTREEWLKYLLEGNNCLAWPSCVVERKIYFNTYSRGYRQLGDVFCWIQYLLQGDIYIVPKELVKFRWHPLGANKNESFASKENIIRTKNEWSDLLNYTVEHMSDDLFLSAFREYLVNPDVVNKKEIECEKLFVLQKLAEKNLDYFPNVLRYYYDHFQYPTDGSAYYGNFSDILTRVYGYTEKDFCQWSGKTCLSQPGVDFAKYRTFVEKEMKKKDKQIQGLKESMTGIMEKKEIARVLYRSQPATTKRMLREVEKLAETIVDKIERLEFADKAGYYDLTKWLQIMQNQVDLLWDDFAYMEFDVSLEEWNLFKELIQMAVERQIDLRESVLPFVKRFEVLLHVLHS